MRKAIALAIAAATAALMTVSCDKGEKKENVINLSVLCMQWTAEQLQNTSAAYAPVETVIMDTIWFEPKEWDDAYLAKLQKQEDKYARGLFATDIEKSNRANAAIDSLEKVREQYLEENKYPGGLVLRHVFKANTEQDTVYLVFDLHKMVIAGETMYIETPME